MFWRLTPAEVVKILSANRDKALQDHEAKRVLNWELATLISFAQHKPDKMPKYKALNAPAVDPDNEVNQARARGAFIALALRSQSGSSTQ